MLRRSEDEAISLFAGLLANPDMTLSLDAYAFWKITAVFYGTDDAHQEDG